MRSQRFRITDDSGFLALIDPDAYRSFVDADWTLEQLFEHFKSEIDARHALIWGTGREEGWRVQVTFSDVTNEGFREFVAPIAASGNCLLLTNYESLTT